MQARFIALALLAVSAFAAPPCTLRHPVVPGDTLSDLATFYYGSPDYAPAILIGTNSRTGEGFPYISNPFSPPKGDLCIPDAAEAQDSHARYATYLKAIAATSTTQPSQESGNLVTIPANQPVTVATWTRADQAAKLKDKAPNDIWVTVEPHLKEFCSAYSPKDDLTQRLEQRLGLPPAAGETTFVRIRLTRPDSKTVFRPCSDPATAVAHCQAGPPSGKDPAYTAWFTGQYYSAFGLPRPNLYPWTSLGYTFDWAQGDDGEFKRFGESEFVIPKGTPIEALGSMSTAEYCR
jgi:hypothetical protein